MVAQIDKQQLPVVALAVHPTRQPRRLARIGETQRSAIVGSISVHHGRSCSRRREHGTVIGGCQAGRGDRRHGARLGLTVPELILVRADDVIE